MTKQKNNLRKVVAVAICLAVSATMFAQENVNYSIKRGKESKQERKEREIGTINELVFDRGKIWANGYKLNNKIAQKTMSVNTDAFRMYNKAMKQKSSGNALIGVGATIFAGASYCFLSAFMEGVLDGDGISEAGFPRTMLFVGTGAAAASLGLIGGGIGLRVKSKKSLQKSVDMFNMNKTPQVSVNMGLTGNGFGLVLNF